MAESNDQSIYKTYKSINRYRISINSSLEFSGVPQVSLQRSRRTSTPISKREQRVYQEFPSEAWTYSLRKYASECDDVFKNINPARYTMSPRSFYDASNATMLFNDESNALDITMDEIVQKFSVYDMGEIFFELSL
jgi:hypothetical protein